jgi:hypothetical protein
MRGRKIDNGFTIVYTSRKWYESDPFILATQAAQVFYLNDPKLGDSWKVVQKLTNRNIYEIPAIVERDDDQGMNIDVYQECVCDGCNIAIVENSTILCRDDATIPIDELYVQLDPNLFVGNNPLIEEYDTNSDEEEKLSSNNDTDSEVQTTLIMKIHLQATMMQNMMMTCVNIMYYASLSLSLRCKMR